MNVAQSKLRGTVRPCLLFGALLLNLAAIAWDNIRALRARPRAFLASPR